MSTLFDRRVSRRPQMRPLLDQQRTLGNRAVLRLLGVEPGPAEPELPAEPDPPAEPPTPPEPPIPPRRRWLFGMGALAILIALEAARRWLGS